MAIRYRHGDPLMLDYTPGSAKTAGDAVAYVGKNCVVHSDIAANVLGAIAYPNSSVVYEADKQTASDVFALGAVVKLNASGNTVDTSGGAGAQIGVAVKDSANGDATVWFVHTA